MIYDLDGNLMGPVILSIDSAGTSLFSMLIDCETGKKLFADNVVGLTINARKKNDSTWINIETTPIELTPYIPDRTEFEFQIIAQATVTRDLYNFKITVS